MTPPLSTAGPLAWARYWSAVAREHEAYAAGWARAGRAVWCWERAAASVLAHAQAAAFVVALPPRDRRAGER